ncbi:MAG: peptidase [Hyphomicrobiales bacterium]
MTYCVGLLLDGGLVMGADTRTNAGVDNIAVFRKLYVWERRGDRVLILLAAGNLAVTQAVVNLLTEEAEASAVSPKRSKAHPTLYTAPTMFQAARVVGNAVRHVRDMDAPALQAVSESFSASFILGGQIGKERPRLFNVYAAGNFIEATTDTPFFQIGEHKYGKPILDRVADRTMSLGQAGKLLLLSFDSTLRSNLSVGMPLDIMVYARDSLAADGLRRIDRDDPYFKKLSSDWSAALRSSFAKMEEVEH